MVDKAGSPKADTSSKAQKDAEKARTAYTGKERRVSGVKERRVEDPNVDPNYKPAEFPKMVDGTTVHDADEEAALKKATDKGEAPRGRQRP